MAIMHVYIRPVIPAGRTVRTAPPASRSFLRRLSHRAPHTVVPLTALGADGRLHTILRPPGPYLGRRLRRLVDVVDFAYSRPNLSIPAGATVTWRFLTSRRPRRDDRQRSRNVASPLLRGVAVYRQRFDVPGTYRLFCMNCTR